MTINSFADYGTAWGVSPTFGTTDLGQANTNPLSTHLLPTYDTTRLIAMQLSVELGKNDIELDIVSTAKNIYKFITGQTVI